MHLAQASDLQKLQGNKWAWFKATEFVLICYAVTGNKRIGFYPHLQTTELTVGSSVPTLGTDVRTSTAAGPEVLEVHASIVRYLA